MKKLCSLVFSLVLALSQLLPTSFAPALAQAAAPAAPAPAPAPAQPATPSYNMPNAMSGDGGFGNDVCKPVPMMATQIPPSMNPPDDWRGKFINLYIGLTQDGGVDYIRVIRPSGSDSFDAAAIARVKQSWRWAPLICGRSQANTEATVAIPRLTCNSRGWTPQPPLALAPPRRSVSAAIDMTVEPDGRIRDVHISDGSGDAALDAALLAHVEQNWRLFPLKEGCPAERKHVRYRMPERACVPMPVIESRTAPPVQPQDRPRSVDLQMEVAPDGKLISASVINGSGDAALDAAAMAHVKTAWRWQPVTCTRTEIYARGTALPVIDMARVTFPVRGGV